MSQTLIVSSSPHAKGDLTVARIMWGVVIALVPVFVASALVFGARAIMAVLVTSAACVVTEYVIQRYFLKQRATVSDGSAVVTGMLLAFNVSVAVPMWQLVVGSIVAIGVAKMAFGGLGANPFNPALIGRAFMTVSFPVHMNTWPLPQQTLLSLGADRVTGATALGQIADAKALGEPLTTIAAELPSYWQLFLGTVGGSMGEISALAVLIGGAYMLYRQLISWETPVIFLGTLAVITGTFWVIDPTAYADPLFHVLAGGAMLGAWFMATDMTTSPMSRNGKIVFAVGCGFITAVIRLFGGFPEGVTYAILIMNAFVPIIDNKLRPRRFGKGAAA